MKEPETLPVPEARDDEVGQILRMVLKRRRYATEQRLHFEDLGRRTLMREQPDMAAVRRVRDQVVKWRAAEDAYLKLYAEIIIELDLR